MSESLTNFMIELATDPERMQRFLRDPIARLDEAGVTGEAREAILARDYDRIRAALASIADLARWAAGSNDDVVDRKGNGKDHGKDRGKGDSSGGSRRPQKPSTTKTPAKKVPGPAKKPSR